MSKQGFLMVAMEPPPELEEEFNDWYDTEHLPEREAVAGFESAARFVCLQGWPRYLAFYDLRDAEVIDQPGYRSISGSAFSPWSRRILARVQGLWRAHGEQVYTSHDRLGTMVRLVLLRFRGVESTLEPKIVDALNRLLAALPGEARLKLLRNRAAGAGEYAALVASSEALDPSRLSLKPLDGFARHVDMANIYAPYWRRAAIF